MTDIKVFTETFNRIAQSKSDTEVFDDFLDISICALSGQQYEEEYLAIIKKYGKEQVNLHCELFAHMVAIMDADGQGFTDCLGEFFQSHITHGRHGQFFTPSHVTDFMAQITMDETTAGKTIMDPACGSGRMLLSAAKVNRHNHFFGADIDHRCVKMATVNLCLNGITGEVAWMNSLSFEHWGGYSIKYRQHAHLHFPVIIKLPPNEGIIYNNCLNRAEEEQPPSRQTNLITVTQTKLNLE
jgi:type I restriction-modification system DNA methylase subunit